MSQRFRRCCTDPRTTTAVAAATGEGCASVDPLVACPTANELFVGSMAESVAFCCREREPDHERRQEQKQVERASNNMRLSRRRILFFS